MLSIFLDVPDDELRKRLKSRGESYEQIEKRLSRADLERNYKKYYDLVIENNELNHTIKTILEFINNKLEIK